jgi:glutamine synthetase
MRQGDILGLKPTWGYDHRFATIRVPPPRGEGTRLQYRLADAAANPYLVAAVLLQAARLGDKSRLSAGKALNDHGDGDGDDGRTTPSTLDEAIQALRSDGELGSALGLDLVDNFCELKTIEWKTFVDAEPRWADKIDEFSEWERENYLPFH